MSTALGTAAAMLLFPALAAAFGPDTGCRGLAVHPCLPGLDRIGVGYDAVTGLPAGNPVVNLTFATAGNVWPSPFDNSKPYSYADQVTVAGHTEGATSHSVYRSVADLAASQSAAAQVSAHDGAFFTKSTETEWASSNMKDGLHIVAVSEYKLGVYSMTLKPPQLLKAHPDLLAHVATLPELYDGAAYKNFIKYFGTHYQYRVTLGGRARLNTVVANGFSSVNSDSLVQASVSASWHALGGGGSSSTASTAPVNLVGPPWQNSSTFATETVGGDKSIDAFTADGQGWDSWVKSVLFGSGAPTVVSVALEPVWSLVPPGPKQDNMIEAVREYAANVTWPSANLTQYTMVWCDCESLVFTYPTLQPASFPEWAALGKGPAELGGTCVNGKMMTAIQGQRDKYADYSWGSIMGIQCCRPCFSAQN